MRVGASYTKFLAEEQNKINFKQSSSKFCISRFRKITLPETLKSIVPIYQFAKIFERRSQNTFMSKLYVL